MASHLVPHDPAHERFDAVARAVVTGALAATAAVLAVAVLGWNGSPQGWLLVVAAVLAAVVPLARWRRSAGRADRLPVGHLDPPWRAQLARAASAVERIELARDQAAPGAVADHLELVHATACHHLGALHRTASLGAPLDPGARGALLADEALTVRRLVELADAAERLRAAQCRQLGPDPLAALVERTEGLAVSLDPTALASCPLSGPAPRHPGEQEERGRQETGAVSARGAGERPAPAWPTTGR